MVTYGGLPERVCRSCRESFKGLGGYCSTCSRAAINKEIRKIRKTGVLGSSLCEECGQYYLSIQGHCPDCPTKINVPDSFKKEISKLNLEVEKKVIVNKVTIPAEHTKDLRIILETYLTIMQNNTNALPQKQKAVAFARALLRKMNGEEK
jgi:hypothetical protein